MILIRNGTVISMEGPDIPDGSVLADGGVIKAVGKGITAPADCEIIDAGGGYILPGFIDAHTHLGTHETGLRWEGNDTNEATEPLTPHLRALDGINPMDESFAASRGGGITAAAVSPGSANVIGGYAVAIKTGGSVSVDGLVMRQPLAMKCALGENPKSVYGQGKKVSPQTRMASAALFREAMLKAREYMEKKEKAEPDKKPDYNMRHEALIPVLKGEIPIHIHAHRADDIHTAIRLAKEFSLKAVLVHCTEGHLIPESVKESGFAAMVGPTLTHKSKPEVINKTFATVNILNSAGVRVCITTDHPVTPLQHLPLCAALAVQAGMDRDEALKAISIYPAEIMGLSHRIGSLKEGKDADIVVWDKHPLDATASVQVTLIDGKIYSFSPKSFTS
ncbi:MAG: amidohydrolase [Clostridiales bacterium]|jgi:imidazolonepropionase-like amidohydrolase|nr:amidohydrolase [Clostridiales bacterium]